MSNVFRLARCRGQSLWAGCCLLAVATLFGGSTSLPRAEAVEESLWVMFRDPQLPLPATEVRFPEGLVDLWDAALKRPEREYRRGAAAAIAEAHQKGLTGLERTIPNLMQLLQQPVQDRSTRLAAVRALVVLDASQAAELLCGALQPADLEMAEWVEPALARWSYAPARTLWLRRLGDEVTLRRMHILAIRGLTALGETEALPRLLALTLDGDVPSAVRLEAALAVGQLQSSGLEATVAAQIVDQSPRALVNRIAAAHMLKSHRGEETQRLLIALTEDPSPAVQAIALRQLLQIDPQLIVPLTTRTLASPDEQVRRLSADALIAVAAAPAHVATLGTILDDPHSGLRSDVRAALVRLAQDPALRNGVIETGRNVLAGDGWRGQEQSILLLVALEDTTIVSRLLSLLENARPEVHTAAAWGLCQLQVPESAESIFNVLRTKTQRWQTGQPQADATDVQLTHLAQALGQLRYAPADSLLRELVPKAAPFPPMYRAAAIWALGKLHADQPDAELAEQLVGRASDIRSVPPEDTLVRRMAAVAVGRTKVPQTVAGLRGVISIETVQSDTGVAAAWAIEQITGEPMPAIPPRLVREDVWFLVPVDADN